MKALWAIGYDIALTNANTVATERALRSLDLVIVQDMFLNETARQFGSVFLPATSSFERDGTFMNAERRVQRIRKAIEHGGPVEGLTGKSFARSLKQWAMVITSPTIPLKRFGMRFAPFGPQVAGSLINDLDVAGLQWPIVLPKITLEQKYLLHSDGFPIGKAALRRIRYRPTKEVTDEEFPFLLITGRTLHQFNAETMTMRTANALLRPTDMLDISHDDAERLHLHDGEWVRLRSHYGTATIPDSNVRPL